MFYSVASHPTRSSQRQYTPAAGNGALERFLSNAVSSNSELDKAKPVSVEDLETSYALQLDVPGVAKEHLDIGIEGDVVRVTSKSDAARSVKAAWRFPVEIDAANSTAKLENGVLSLSLGKKIPVSNVAQLVIR